MPRDKKYWKNRFGDPFGKRQPYYQHLDLRRIDDLDDIGFAYMMEGVKGVNILDLNETEITNESIKLLTTLEYVTELRAKGMYGLTDECAEDLNRIKGLQLLHVKNTLITIDGLLKLTDQQQLKKILFSATDVEAIKEKMLQLKAMHPGCEFGIDGKPYYFDNVERFMYAVKAQPYTYKLKIKNESAVATWSNWLGQPSDHYIEAEMQGPYSLDDIEWVEINPIESRKEGRLIPGKEVDHSAEIIKLLEELSFPFMITGQMISFYLLQKEL